MKTTTAPLTLAGLMGLALLAAMLAACGGSSGCPSYKTSVQLWTQGPAYKGAVARITADSTLDDDSRRVELMSIAGLGCAIDEDNKKSTTAAPSPACKCAKPASADAANTDCAAWAKSF